MKFNIQFQLFSLFYSIIFLIIFVSKPRLQSLENKMYKGLVTVNITTLILDLLSVFTINFYNGTYLNMFVAKAYLLSLAIWILLFVLYFVATIANSKPNRTKILHYYQLNKNNKLFFNLLILITIIASFLIVLLPLYFYNNNGVYSYGPASMILYVLNPIMLIICLTIIVKNLKIIKKQRVIPVLAFILLAIIAIPIQFFNPSILLISSVQAAVIILMFNTIENPDMRMINELNIAKDTAEKANNFKTEFLSNMSHEVRTPLNAIVGFSESLTEEELPKPAQESVKDIVMASNNLLEIVNSILDISKIEANKIEIVNTDYSTEALIDELISLTKGRIMDKPLEFRTSFDSSLPQYLHGDHQRLKQVIVNLLTNSVKYTKEGYIEFKINCVQINDICRLIISVEDSGIGIKPEKIDKLFTKFERLDVQNNTTAEGTGLGLAIAKMLVELMGGKIVCQSIYGKGSRFTVAVNQKIVTGTPVITNQSNKNKTLNIGKIDLSDKTILLVDDNVVNLKVASKLLQPYKVKTIEVTSGIECIELIKQGNKYDLILMDDMMPKMKGTEALHILRQDSSFNIPVVALTANAISGMREKYLNDGFDDYLAKPIDRSELDRVMKEYLSD